MGGGGPVGADTADVSDAPPSGPPAPNGPLESGDDSLCVSPRSRLRHPLVWILAGGFALRLIVFLYALGDPNRFYSPDGREYWLLAQHFGAAFGNTHSEVFDLGLKRTPGYPALLAAITSLTGDRESVVIFVQVLMSVATIALLYLLVRELCSYRAAVIACAFLAADPISVIMPSYLQPETFFTLVIVGGTLLLVRAIRTRSWILLAASGGAFGASVLIRPVALYIWIIVIPLVWLLSSSLPWRQRLVNSGILLLAFLVPVAGWMVRNERTTGVFVLSTIEGRDLLEFRASYALAFDRGARVADVRHELFDKVNRETQGKNAAEYSRTETSEAIRTLLGHPIGTAVTTAKGTAHLLIGPGRAELFRVVGLKHPNHIGGLRTVVFGIEALLLLALLVGAAAGGVLSIRQRNWRVLAIGAGLGGYLIVIASSGAAYSRYRAPAAPYLALLAGFAGAWLLTAVRSYRRVGAPASDVSQHENS